MCAAAKKAVKVGVNKDVWYAIKAHSGKKDLTRNVEKALQTYLDILRNEAVIIKDGEKYSIVNAFELDFELIVNCDIFPVGNTFNEKVLTHLISLVLPRANEGSYKVEDWNRGSPAIIPEPMPQHDMYPEILARKLLRGDVVEVTLSLWKAEPPDFREDFAVFKKDTAFVMLLSEIYKKKE